MSTLDQAKVYDQLCQSYRAIDDFRSKLLAALPVVNGAGLFSLIDKLQSKPAKPEVFVAAGVFGALITIGFFAFEIYAIKKCGALITAGKRLEKDANIFNGQFETRPQNTAVFINEPFASGVIYPAVIAAWLYFALTLLSPRANPWIPLAVGIIGFIGTLAYDCHLRKFYGDTTPCWPDWPNRRKTLRKKTS